MGVFSRLADIVNANITSLLDKAEDPEKMIRLIIQEMEDTLVELRSTSARLMAEQRDLQRKHQRFDDVVADWQNKAELAIAREREDLARLVLIEKQQVLKQQQLLGHELEQVDESLQKLAQEISQLESKLEETRAKQRAMVLRAQAAQGRVAARNQLDSQRIAHTMERFNAMERRIDELEAQADVINIAGNHSLEQEIAQLQADSEIEQELAALRARVKPQ